MDVTHFPQLYQTLNNHDKAIRLFRITNCRITDLPITRLPTTGEILRSLVSKIFRCLFEAWVPSWFLPKQNIIGELETFPLAEAPPYHALSYVWGDSKITEAIKIGDHTVQVTMNLLSALRRLNRDYELEYLWIDAICINQKDDDEKSNQIPMMGEIFNGAEFVLMWLGEEQTHTARAFSIIQKCADSLAQIPPLSINESMTPKGTALLLGQSRILDLRKNRVALSEFSRNPYWQRVWTLQEAARAKRAIMIVGRLELDFVGLMLASYFWLLRTAASYQHTGSDPLDERSVLKPFDVFRTVTMGYRARGEQFSNELMLNGDATKTREDVMAYWDDSNPSSNDIFELFEKTRSCKATDLRDRFFALGNLLSPERNFLQPSYRMSADEVYRTLIVEGIRSTRSLSCISFEGIGVYAVHNSNNGPSWIPDFTRLGDSNLPHAVTIYTRQFRGGLPFAASGANPPVYNISADMVYLHAKGFICGTVETVVQHHLALQFIEEIIMSVKMDDIRVDHGTELFWQLFEALCPLSICQGETLNSCGLSPEMTDAMLQDELNVFASGFLLCLGYLRYKNHFRVRTVAMEKSRWLPMQDTEMVELVLTEGNPALSYFIFTVNRRYWFRARDRELVDALYQQACQVFQNSSGSPMNQRVVLIDWRNSGVQTWQVVMSLFYKLVGSMWAFRSFVVTDQAHMGFARPGTRIGDKVCILYGCSVPLILRPVGSEYLLVGDSHFDGMMQGEMVKKQEAGQFVVQTLTIK